MTLDKPHHTVNVALQRMLAITSVVQSHPVLPFNIDLSALCMHVFSFSCKQDVVLGVGIGPAAMFLPQPLKLGHSC